MKHTFALMFALGTASLLLPACAVAPVAEDEADIEEVGEASDELIATAAIGAKPWLDQQSSSDLIHIHKGTGATGKQLSVYAHVDFPQFTGTLTSTRQDNCEGSSITVSVRSASSTSDPTLTLINTTPNNASEGAGQGKVFASPTLAYNPSTGLFSISRCRATFSVPDCDAFTAPESVVVLEVVATTADGSSQFNKVSQIIHPEINLLNCL